MSGEARRANPWRRRSGRGVRDKLQPVPGHAARHVDVVHRDPHGLTERFRPDLERHPRQRPFDEHRKLPDVLERLGRERRLLELPRGADEPGLLGDRRVLLRRKPFHRLRLVLPGDRYAAVAQVLRRAERPVPPKSLGAGYVAALEVRGVERQRAARAEDLPDLGQRAALVRHEMDRVAEDDDVDLRHETAQVLGASLHEPHHVGGDAPPCAVELHQRGIDRVDQQLAALAHVRQDQLGNRAGTAGQVDDAGSQRGDPLHQPAVDFDEERVASKAPKAEPIVLDHRRSPRSPLPRILSIPAPSPVRNDRLGHRRALGAARCRLVHLRRRIRGHPDRIAEVAPDHRADRIRQARGKQRRLPRRRRPDEDLLDFRPQPHLQHAVGIVQHQHVHAAQRQRPLAEVLQHPRRGPDDDVGLLPKARHLAGDRLAGVHRDDPQARMGPELRQIRDHAARLVPGRREHEPLDGLAPRVQPLQHGDAERRGGPRAGLRLADQVPPDRQARDHLGLDRGG